MINSVKAKAIVAAIATVIIGVLGQLANNVWVSGTAHTDATVIIAVVTALAATLGVYGQANAPAPTPAPATKTG